MGSGCGGQFRRNSWQRALKSPCLRIVVWLSQLASNAFKISQLLDWGEWYCQQKEIFSTNCKFLTESKDIEDIRNLSLHLDFCFENHSDITLSLNPITPEKKVHQVVAILTTSITSPPPSPAANERLRHWKASAR